MFQFTEDLVKEWLRVDGIPVPCGRLCRSAEEAADAVRDLGGTVAVKAAVAAGRRRKLGGIVLVSTPGDAGKAAASLIGRMIAGQIVEKIYVEQAVEIERELYLSFVFDGPTQKVVVGGQGGVDIEGIARSDPGAVFIREIDPLEGIATWIARDLWERAGVRGASLVAVAALTHRLYDVFSARDAVMLELNPIALTKDGRAVVVGAMMEGDANAVGRHPEWGDAVAIATAGARLLNERERAVVNANRTHPGGAVRYVELEGNIGLLVGGGGAGLLQHDMIIRAGGSPANHTDTSPGNITEKLKVILEQIFANPRTRSLLLSYNRQQMSRCDLKIEALLDVLRRKKIDPKLFPIVIRLSGSSEERARSLAAEFPDLQYLPSNASLDDAVSRIVELTRRASARKAV